MAKTLNFEKILSASLLVSKIPREVFVEQVSRQLEDQSIMEGLSNKELGETLEKLNLEATTKDFLASLLDGNYSSKDTDVELGNKIDSLKESIDKLNANIEKLIK